MTIRHRTGTYEVRFVPLQESLASLPEAAYIVTDRNLYRHYAQSWPPGVPTFQAEPGEASKSPETYLAAIHWLATNGAQRNTVIVAIGGGVVGDLAGFAAATYMRGVSYLQVPTSLLAQVDSSVGGKVGVDLPEGKNMVGAFYPPTEVRVAIDALQTLPKREFANGMAEVLKYGFIMAPDILDINPVEQIRLLVERCIECKRKVVEEDELETTGRRAILNFGHTVGHALEHSLGYADLLHGEATSIGMVAEARLGERLKMSPPGTANIVAEHLNAHDLPTAHAMLQHPARLIDAMRRDKKSTGGKLAFSLLRSIGSCELVSDVDEAEVVAALTQ